MLYSLAPPMTCMTKSCLRIVAFALFYSKIEYLHNRDIWKETIMATVQVRYIVHDVDAAIRFYCTHLGFKEVMHPAPAFAMLTHGDLRLVLSAPSPAAGGGQPMPDGTKQEPGGWNRFAI